MEIRTVTSPAGKIYTLHQSQRSFYVTAVVLIAMGVLMLLTSKTDGLGGWVGPVIFAGIGVHLWLKAEGYETVVDMGEKQVSIERRVGEQVETRSIPFAEIAAIQCTKVWFHNNDGARLPSIAVALRLHSDECVIMSNASVFSHAEALRAAMLLSRALGVRLEQPIEHQRI